MTTSDQFPRGSGDGDHAGSEAAGGGSHTSQTDSQGDPRIAAMEADLHETRQELARTVDELTSRLDVKTRSREALAARKEQATAAATRLRSRVAEGTSRASQRARASVTDEQGRPTGTARIGAVAAGVVLTGVVAVVIWRRSRR